jgi:hypothetical protein
MESGGPRPIVWLSALILLVSIVGAVVYYYRRPPSDPAQFLVPVTEPVHTIEYGKADDCGFNNDVASMASTHEVKFTIFNSQEVPYDVAWIDFQGNHRHYTTLNPHSGWSTPTYYGHRWVLSALGKCAYIFTMGEHDLNMDLAAADDPWTKEHHEALH